jgi:hypothetical protein
MKVSMRAYDSSDGVLAGRTEGEMAWRDIERVIEKAHPDEVVALDLHGVRAISVPFADACLGRLLSGKVGGFYEEHPLVLLNANEDVRETIAAALRLRHLVALSLSADGPHLLGADEVLAETMGVAVSLQEFTVLDLAQELHLSAQAANNRLRLLTRCGALHRQRVNPRHGGREFRYRVPFAQNAPQIEDSSMAAEDDGSATTQYPLSPPGGRRH